MTIKPHVTWERPVSDGLTRIRVQSLAEAHRIINQVDFESSIVCLDVSGSDEITRTLGITPSDGEPLFEYPIDLIRVNFSLTTKLALAHVIARSPLFRDAMFVMNGQRVGEWNLGRKAHPNDEKLDVVTWNGLSYLNWRQVRSRLPLGSFAPHPQITEVRLKTHDETFAHARKLDIDGLAYGKVTEISVSVMPDALVLVA